MCLCMCVCLSECVCVCVSVCVCVCACVCELIAHNIIYSTDADIAIFRKNYGRQRGMYN